MSLKKAQQDELKDIGGFMGGTLNGPRRKANNVTGRDIITLDLDNIPAGGTDDVLRRVEALGCGYCVYSTRKHQPAAPRLRILLPMDRTVTADEYEPIARIAAQKWTEVVTMHENKYTQKDLIPAEVSVLSLFDGMSCGMIAMLNAGLTVKSYDAYEIDKYAVKTASHNFPLIRQHGDVFSADFTRYKGVDYIIGGSPCKYWSIAQKNNRETEASGTGWELFQQYVRATRRNTT